MQGLGRRLGALCGCVLTLVLVHPAASQAATRISGSADYDTTKCPGPPAAYADFDAYPGLALEGSLDGCLYTKVTGTHETPSGVYLETGQEVFVGRLDGGPMGTFTTGYRFESKWDPDVSTGVEVHGRCQHPIIAGSGTGGFAGATGRLDFKDFPGEPVPYVYRGSVGIS